VVNNAEHGAALVGAVDDYYGVGIGHGFLLGGWLIVFGPVFDYGLYVLLNWFVDCVEQCVL
ncbi:MAG: hypothetical protein EBW87_03765, partial [Burkholderiaceae bacterium]|nr:hypothetical protein [Burkholderiaceae bacterium]